LEIRKTAVLQYATVHRNILLLAVSLALVAAVTVVGFARSDVNPAADLSSAAPMRAATPVPVAAAHQPSPPGGLGNTQADLEQVDGQPTGLAGTMIAYRNGRYAATYLNGRATQVLESFEAQPASLAHAKAAVERLLPADSELVGTLGLSNGRTADLYRSARLGATMASPTPGVARGQFVVVYQTNGAGQVESVLLSVGGVPTS
jgi:hypothetical protein